MTQADLAAAGAPAGSTALDRLLGSALPTGWSVVGRCRSGTGEPGPCATGCHALAHPDVGVALIDIVPDATPNAEARLRRTLAAAGFRSDFPGALPVLHHRLNGSALGTLPRVLEQGFTALLPLTVPGGRAWVAAVRRALEADPAWELPGQPKATSEIASALAGGAGPRVVAQPRRRRRLLAAAFAATFVLGLAAGFLLSESPTPEARRTALAPPSQAAVPPPSATPVKAGAAAPTATPTERPGTMPQQAALAAEGLPPAVPPPLLSTTDAAAAPVGAAHAVEPPRATPAAVARPVAPAPTRLQEPGAAPEAAPAAQPASPTQAAKAPLRAAAARIRRPSAVLDPVCSAAMLRFQQGERLTSAEQAFVRAGCSAVRR